MPAGEEAGWEEDEGMVGGKRWEWGKKGEENGMRRGVETGHREGQKCGEEEDKNEVRE